MAPVASHKVEARRITEARRQLREGTATILFERRQHWSPWSEKIDESSCDTRAVHTC